MNAMARREFLRAAGWAAAGMATTGRQASAGADGPNPAPLKVGQIGTAHAHASGKMSTLRDLREDYEVVGIVEPDPARRRAAEQSAAYRGLPWLTEEQLLATPGLKVVAVETTVSDLVATASRCIAAGMHVHMDKPAGESLGPLRQLLADATARQLTVQLGYMFRHNPAFRFCFQAVRDGWLGKIFEVHGVMSKHSPLAERRGNLPLRHGTLFELGCHLIDALVQVLGKTETITTYSRSVRPDLDAVADSQLAVFEYPTATATIRVSLNEVEGGRRRQFVVCGTEGTLEIKPLEPPRATLALTRPRGKFRQGYQEVELPAMPGRYDDHLRELARIARGEAVSEYSPAHDLAVQEMILRAAGLPPS
jgi:predicted dehydrogenase